MKIYHFKIILAVFIGLFNCFMGFSQPFTMDETIKPIEIPLKDSSKYEGAKYAEYQSSLKMGDSLYLYITGHDMYQFVDVFVFSEIGNPDFKASICANTWKSFDDIQSTSQKDDGIINFKIRSYRDIGLMIESPNEDLQEFTVIVNASKPVTEFLGSPFVNADKKAPINEETPDSGNPAQESNLWLYITIGVLILVVGLLAGRLLGRKNQANVLLILVLSSIFNVLQAQDIKVREQLEKIENERRQEQVGIQNTRRAQIDQGIDRLNKWFATGEAMKKAYEQYKNLQNCMQSGPPPGQPRIPSFCAQAEGNCSRCFAAARDKFNRVRYTLEKLQTIYECNKNFTDAALALGDNVSGYHSVGGLAWQMKRTKIVKSLQTLEGSYDRKRMELLEKLNESLLELSKCEAEYGMEDWYDRFGVLFYDFLAMRYHR